MSSDASRPLNQIQNIPSQLPQGVNAQGMPQGLGNNPLDQLKDIQLPQEIGLWPLAWPWWALLLFVVASIVFYWLYKKKTAWRKAALQQLNDLDENQHQFPLEANRLLKQIALGPLALKQCASLSGDTWIDFLNTHSKQPLFNETLSEFGHAPDNPNINMDNKQLKRAIEQWIKQQKAPRRQGQK